LQEPGGDAADRRGRLDPLGRRRLPGPGRPPEDHRSRPGPGAAGRRHDVRAQVPREQAQVLAVRQGGGHAGRRSPLRHRVDQHRPGGGRELGGASGDCLYELHRPQPAARGLRAHPAGGRAGEPKPARRRGDHPHPQGAAGLHRPEVRGPHRGALRRARPRGGGSPGHLRGRSDGHDPRGRGNQGGLGRGERTVTATAGPLLEVDGISVRFGALLALNRVSLTIPRGEIAAIIGPNGAGKTTLLNCISGFYHPYEGHIRFDGRDRTHLRPPDVAALGIARTFQNVALFRGMSVLDNIMTGRILKMRGSFLLDAIWWGPARRQELEHRAFVERIIDFLEIQAIRKTPAGRLPYGLQKRVELARALAAEPQLLLLDEPMAGMNVEEKEDMCRFILDVNSEFGTTIALIEPDMGVVMDISDHVVVLDYGRTIADGTPEQVRKEPAVLDAYLGDAHE